MHEPHRGCDPALPRSSPTIATGLEKRKRSSFFPLELVFRHGEEEELLQSVACRSPSIKKYCGTSKRRKALREKRGSVAMGGEIFLAWYTREIPPRTYSQFGYHENRHSLTSRRYREYGYPMFQVWLVCYAIFNYRNSSLSHLEPGTVAAITRGCDCHSSLHI